MKYIQATIEVLNPEEELRVHDASMTILNQIGIHMPEKRVLERFEFAGAQVDWDTQIVRIPEKLVWSVLEKVQKADSGIAEQRAISALRLPSLLNLLSQIILEKPDDLETWKI